mmetsp:Transcript_6483/g.16087  ORF Transcript_6483/g.16087 Transcript_6483/m.16087 type:complete len:323 (+) Transcript_6483:105-1073(+)
MEKGGKGRLYMYIPPSSSHLSPHFHAHASAVCVVHLVFVKTIKVLLLCGCCKQSFVHLYLCFCLCLLFCLFFFRLLLCLFCLLLFHHLLELSWVHCLESAVGDEVRILVILLFLSLVLAVVSLLVIDEDLSILKEELLACCDLLLHFSILYLLLCLLPDPLLLPLHEPLQCEGGASRWKSFPLLIDLIFEVSQLVIVLYQHYFGNVLLLLLLFGFILLLLPSFQVIPRRLLLLLISFHIFEQQCQLSLLLLLSQLLLFPCVCRCPPLRIIHCLLHHVYILLHHFALVFVFEPECPVLDQLLLLLFLCLLRGLRSTSRHACSI